MHALLQQFIDTRKIDYVRKIKTLTEPIDKYINKEYVDDNNQDFFAWLAILYQFYNEIFSKTIKQPTIKFELFSKNQSKNISIIQHDNKINTLFSTYAVLTYIANDYTKVPEKLVETIKNLYQQSIDTKSKYSLNNDTLCLQLLEKNINIYEPDELLVNIVSTLFNTITAKNIESILILLCNFLSKIHSYNISAIFYSNLYNLSFYTTIDSCECPSLYAPQPLTPNPMDKNWYKNRNFSSLLYKYEIYRSSITKHTNVNIYQDKLKFVLSDNGQTDGIKDKLFIAVDPTESSQKQSFDINDKAGSNGMLSYFKTIKNDTYNVLDHYDVLKLFDIYNGSIITAKKLFGAISFIFECWLRNLKNINIQYNICHCNCHSNISDSNYNNKIINALIEQLEPLEYTEQEIDVSIHDEESAHSDSTFYYAKYIFRNDQQLSHCLLSDITAYLSTYVSFDNMMKYSNFRLGGSVSELPNKELSDVVDANITYSIPTQINIIEPENTGDITSIVISKYNIADSIALYENNVNFPLNFPTIITDDDNFKLSCQYKVSSIAVDLLYKIPYDTYNYKFATMDSNRDIKEIDALSIQSYQRLYTIATNLFLANCINGSNIIQYDVNSPLNETSSDNSKKILVNQLSTDFAKSLSNTNISDFVTKYYNNIFCFTDSSYGNIQDFSLNALRPGVLSGIVDGLLIGNSNDEDNQIQLKIVGNKATNRIYNQLIQQQDIDSNNGKFYNELSSIKQSFTTGGTSTYYTIWADVYTKLTGNFEDSRCIILKEYNANPYYIFELHIDDYTKLKPVEGFQYAKLSNAFAYVSPEYMVVRTDDEAGWDFIPFSDNNHTICRVDLSENLTKALSTYISTYVSPQPGVTSCDIILQLEDENFTVIDIYEKNILVPAGNLILEPYNFNLQLDFDKTLSTKENNISIVYNGILDTMKAQLQDIVFRKFFLSFNNKEYPLSSNSHRILSDIYDLSIKTYYDANPDTPDGINYLLNGYPPLQFSPILSSNSQNELQNSDYYSLCGFYSYGKPTVYDVTFMPKSLSSILDKDSNFSTVLNKYTSATYFSMDKSIVDSIYTNQSSLSNYVYALSIAQEINDIIDKNKINNAIDIKQSLENKADIKAAVDDALKLYNDFYENINSVFSSTDLSCCSINTDYNYSYYLSTDYIFSFKAKTLSVLLKKMIDSSDYSLLTSDGLLFDIDPSLSVEAIATEMTKNFLTGNANFKFNKFGMRLTAQ